MDQNEDLQEAESGTSIELLIADDGSMTVEMETQDTDEEKPVPAKNIDDALRIIREMAGRATGGTDLDAEDKAYKAEMAAPISKPMGTRA